ncbi:MAG: DUF885 domain-containing protein [SAR86 cluster bacterium]|uniref:DUF885 domain-containing protein n=1 Tax=SAR86 cluster bacterium TaxID=2030880 RepID=A0A368BRG8_9GAMM|nr:MAG: DUF885 domain-containing protein [SAR86 cluster bacterium]
MMKLFFKFFGAAFGLAFLVCSIYVVNLFSSKPFSLDHYLAKDLMVSLFDSPEYLTYIGAFDFLNPITKHNSKLTNDSLEDAEESHIGSLKHLQVLNSYEDDELTEEQIITKKIAVFDTENDINRFENFRFHSYPVNQISGAHLNAIEFMTDIHPIRNKREANDYLKRVSQIGASMDNLLLWFDEQAKIGIYPPTFVFDHVINQLSEMLSNASNPLQEVFGKKVRELNLSDSEINSLEVELSNIIEKSFNPAYERLLDRMIGDKSNSNPNHGVWSLPNGDEFYKLRIRTYTTTDYSPQEIHDIGLSEVERISERMREIFNELGYDNNKSVGVLLNELNENPDFLYADTPDRKEIVIRDYTAMVAEAAKKIEPYFERMPKASVEVKPVPEYSEQTAAGGYYQGPSLDGERPGVFYANLYDIKQTPTYSMMALTLHEAIPGHHMQIALNQENENLTLYRKQGYRTSAFSEGWALYSEKLSLEAGVGRDLYDELGILQSEIFRAVRLVVDTGMHYKKWTREEAMDYMKTETGMSDTEVRTEIERYIVWPGQALSYKVGMLKILELRERAKAALGEKFDIRKFHTIVLDNGIPPLFVLEELVDSWIEASS